MCEPQTCPQGGSGDQVGSKTVPVVAEGMPCFQVTPAPPCPNWPKPPCCQNVCVPFLDPVVCPPPVLIKKRRYIQPARPKSCKPEMLYRPPCLPMQDDTIYRKSFLPVDAPRAEMVIPPNNICLGTGKISGDTINKMSYQPIKINPPCPILPCEHKLLGDGPMQDITTTRHDYVPKPYSKPDLIPNKNNLYSSDCPMSNQTTNRMSYLPVGADRVQPILPNNLIEKPCGKFADTTINKLSYMPWEPVEKMDMPWALKQRYQPPKLRMEDNTVHKMSYGPPGTFVDCNDDSADCVPYEVPCGQTPSCPPPNPCCQPCCCPKAAC